MSKQKKDPVASYRQGTRGRIEERKTGAKPSLPNLTGVVAVHDAKGGVPRTLQQLSSIAEAVVGHPTEAAPAQTRKPGLSPQTIAGLESMQAAIKKSGGKMSEPQVEKEDQPKSDPEPRPVREKTADLLQGMDEYEFESILRNIQQDVLNNEEQRLLIADIVGEIDIATALGDGEMRQVVPIKKNQLEVTYRSVSGYENQQLRVLLFEYLHENPTYEPLSADIFHTMQLSCSVIQINSNRLPEHMEGTGYERTFNPKIAMQKYLRLLHYPGSILHALGVHAHWFDRRCREALKVTNLKNG